MVWVHKMTTTDDPEAFLNAFERTTTVAGWPQDQWASVLIPHLIGPAQQAIGTLFATDLTDYAKVKAAILQALNNSPEGYC